jgi:hypothetical protein
LLVVGSWFLVLGHGQSTLRTKNQQPTTKQLLPDQLSSMNILFSVLGFFAHIPILWRIIGLVGASFLISKGCEDLAFLNQYKTRKTFSIEELTRMNQDSIPPYLTVSHALPVGAGVLETSTKKNGDKTQTFIYPVLSLEEATLTDETLAKTDTAHTPVAKVIFKKGFKGAKEEVSVNFEETIQGVEGTFQGEGLGDNTRNLLEDKGYKIDPNPIVISESHDFPTASGSYKQIIFCILVWLLGLGSFWWQFIGRPPKK